MKPTPLMPLLEFCEAYAAERKLAPKTGSLLERLCRRVTVILARPPIVADLRRDVFDQIKGSPWRGFFIALWRFAADSAQVPLDADLRRHERSGRPAKREWPTGELAAFVGGLLRPRDPAERKLRLLLAHLADAFGRAPLLSDLNAIALAAMVNYLRSRRKLSTAFVADCRKRFRFVWREAAAQGLAGDVPRTVRGKAGRKSARRLPLTAALQRRIATAVGMRAAGDDWETIARHFKLTSRAVLGWRARWPDYWKAELDKAMQAESERLRQLAGSSAVLDAPDFARVVERCEAWAKGRGESLFPEPQPAAVAADPGLHTVSSFLRAYVVPVCLQEAATETVELYGKVARKFDQTMGAPPLAKITNQTLAAFIAILRSMPARGKAGACLSLATVRMYGQHLLTMLAKAGPPGPHNRDGAGILASVPWVKLPVPDLGEPSIVGDDVLKRCYDAAASMETPHEQAAEFWRAILIVGQTWALRCRTMFALTWPCIEWERQRCVIPQAMLKGRRKLILPLVPIVAEHLQPLRRDSGRVFGCWPYSAEYFRRQFHRLQASAGVAEADYFGLHSLRRTSLSKLWEKSPAGAMLLGGHSALRITRDSYVNQEQVLRNALAEGGAA